MPGALTIGIIGAGLSGLTAARRLHRSGFQVEVFDKGREVGGRASTRRHGEQVYDHGAQYFTVSDDRFQNLVDEWTVCGVAAPWEVEVVVLTRGTTSPSRGSMTRYVGVPGMSELCKYLARDLRVHAETRAVKLARSAGSWSIMGEQGELGRCDVALVTVPATQSLALLGGASELYTRINRIRIAPTWALMVEFEERLPVPFEAAFVKDSPLTWIARDSSKPGRPDEERWVLHASPSWSWDRMERSISEIETTLLQAFFEAAGVERVTHSFRCAHLWRYAFPENDVGDYCLWDPHTRIGAAGDWCLPGARLEAAFLSGDALAGEVIESLGEPATA